jgi:hypothetical protein
VSAQLHAPAALPPGKEPPRDHLIGGLVNPIAGLNDVEKREFLTLPRLELRLPVVQPVASRYTDSAIQATECGMVIVSKGNINVLNPKIQEAHFSCIY